MKTNWKTKVNDLIAKRFNQLDSNLESGKVLGTDNDLVFAISVGLPHDHDEDTLRSYLDKIPEIRLETNGYVLHLANAVEAGVCFVQSMPIRFIDNSRDSIIEEALWKAKKLIELPEFKKSFGHLDYIEMNRAAVSAIADNIEQESLQLSETLIKIGMAEEKIHRTLDRMNFIISVSWNLADNLEDYI